MKKLLSCAIILFLALIALTTTVNAAEVSVATEVELISAIVGTDTTITLTNDITLGDKLLIPAGVKVTLNLNGKTLNLANIADNYAAVIKGDLTITGEGTVNVPGPFGFGVSTTAGSALTIENGTFSGPNADYLIGNWGTLVINGGTFSAKYCTVNGFASGSTVQINDGDFDTEDGWTVLGKLEINDGNFTGGTDGLVIATDTEVKINGGNFEGGANGITFSDNTSITGGYFDDDISAYTGAKDAIQDSDGIFFVGTAHNVTINPVENGTVTPSLTKAIQGQTVKLTVTPAEGYKVKKVTVVDVPETETFDITSSLEFSMPNSDAIVSAEFEKVEEPIETPTEPTTPPSEAPAAPAPEPAPAPAPEASTPAPAPAPAPAAPAPTAEKDDTPKTGSDNILSVMVYIVSAISLAAIISKK